MTIVQIQPINGKLSAILDTGQAVPIYMIDGNVSINKGIEQINGNWTITSAAPSDCEK